MNEQELKQHLQGMHGVDTSGTPVCDGQEITWEEAHVVDHQEWLGDDHQHEEQ